MSWFNKLLFIFLSLTCIACNAPQAAYSVWAKGAPSQDDDDTWLGKVPYQAYPNTTAKGKIDGKPVTLSFATLEPSQDWTLLKFFADNNRLVATIIFQPQARVSAGKSFTQIRIPNRDLKNSGYVYDPKGVQDVQLHPKPAQTVSTCGFGLRLSLMPLDKQNAQGQIPVFFVLRWERKYNSYLEGLCWLTMAR